MARVYIIGPTQGLHKLNRQTFDAIAKRIKADGNTPVIPHDLFFDEENQTGGIGYAQALSRRIKELRTCDFAITIPGYSEDRFASAEYAALRNLGIQAINFLNWKAAA